MPKTIFLKKSDTLARQVAEVLIGESGNDLGRVEVWIPTTGAERRIRRALADHGVLSPRFVSPMKALLPRAASNLAQRFEREAAWARVVSEAEPSLLEPLFSEARLENGVSGPTVGGVFCDLCDLLAEGGWNPGSAEVREACGVDSDRWEVLGELHRRQISLLATHGLIDPNEARLVEREAVSGRENLDRLVVACVPDLPVAAQKRAEALEKLGVRVEVLVWMPGEMSAGFDAWGRPDSEAWSGCRIDFDASRIFTARTPEQEAELAMDFALSSQSPGDYAVVLADSTLGNAFRNEVSNRGGRPFLPEGSRLDLTEPGRIALEWERFRETLELRSLRRLLELPRFNRLVRSGLDWSSGDPLGVCDFLIGEALLSDLAQAEALAGRVCDPSIKTPGRRDLVTPFVAAVKALLSSRGPEIIARVWRGGGEGLETARRIVELHEAMSASRLFRKDSPELAEGFARALKSEPVFESSRPGDVELSGWLEAPWIDAERLVLCGCVEGVLPSLTTSHAFLPDSRRRSLGLADNASRFARDAYLFQCLTLARTSGNFSCTLSRFDSNGSPWMPSSLLLRCSAEELPERVLGLFGPVPPAAPRARRVNSWKWNVPESMRRPVEKLSPTDFSDYLACPFRYWLRKARRLDSFVSDAREMDARAFGLLIHAALEAFGKESPGESDAAAIERLVLDHLESSAGNLFGSVPSPAVLVQLEAARARMRAFAWVQAGQFADGWRIVATEEKLEFDGPSPLFIGPLPLSGKIDRIERNVNSGAWRIMDYKTHAKAVPPVKKHLGPLLSEEWLPEAVVETGPPDKRRMRRWADLQLPLYQRILSHLHAGEIGENPVKTAYFTLSADPAETAVVEFGELDEATMESAMRCATAIARRVSEGCFWPPQPHRGSWDDPFDVFFLNGNPEACLSRETIEFLKGAA